MVASPGFAYVQARIQARYGERPQRVVWTNLAQATNYGRYLQQATAGGFGRWLGKLGANSGSHAVEISLREGYREHVREVARWMPPVWRDATLWFALLVDMEQLRRILGEGSLPEWSDDDPFLRRVSADPGDWPLPILANDGNESRGIAGRWRSHWQGAWPTLPARDMTALMELAKIMPVAAFQESVAERLERLFRHQAGRPVAVFAWLALVLMDLLRLKGEMVYHLEFGGQ